MDRAGAYLSVALLVLSAGSARADVFDMPSGQTSCKFVTVGDPGNAADTLLMNDGTTGYGSVPYTFEMGKYDVTVGQYCQFLNAVAKVDTYGLYNIDMASGWNACGIAQSSGVSGYTYSFTRNPNFPVTYVTWGDAARFCNWLQNGQPTVAEGTGTTETGAYTLKGATSNSDLMAITRNAGATYFIPSEDEFYKAAYYRSGSTNAGYWLYPTQSNSVPTNVLSTTGTNNANYYGGYHNEGNGGWSDPSNLLTTVGAFAASPGPYGTFDMGGLVDQWNETGIGGWTRGLRAGNYDVDSMQLAACFRSSSPDGPAWEHDSVGFRVASVPTGWEPVPEPSSITLVVACGLCLLAHARRRRRV